MLKEKELVSDLLFTTADEFIDNIFKEFNLKSAELDELLCKEDWRFDLGFINSIESVDIQRDNEILKERQRKISEKKDEVESRRKKALEIFNFYKECVNYFGEQTILIPKSQLFRIMNKFNMVCGPLSDYTGSIPEDLKPKLTELIEKEKQLCYKSSLDHKILRLHTIKEVEFRDDVNKFREPYFIYKDLIKRYPLFETSDDFRHYLNRMAIEDFGKNSDLKSGIVSINSNSDVNLVRGDRLFICAPVHEMKTREIKTIFSRPKTEDPIIFAECKGGLILCLLSWGEVLTDLLIKKSLEVSKKISLI